MNKFKIIVTSFCFVLLTSFSSDNLPKEFTDLLNRSEMIFNQPEGYSETPMIENEQMNYDYAIVNNAKDFEIRYAIRPLDERIKNYNDQKINGTSGNSNIHPNKLYVGTFHTVIFNVSGGKFSKINEFTPEAIKKEFNADWGAMAMVEVGKEFGQNYKYCFIITIHKDNVGDAYCFYLTNTQESFAKNLQEPFHSLKFK
jgi:hypothetical protein